MNDNKRYCVIMAGGVGSRFWPLSRRQRPKQFLDILGTGRSFLRHTFERFRNVSITQNGKVAAGEWIDVIRFRDWLQEEITVNVFNALVNSDKVPYTDDGIAIIETQIRQA